MIPFSDLGLSDPILRAFNDNGYTQATPIQKKAIPAILSGADIMAAAQTGTGKTAAFVAPILQQLNSEKKTKANHTRALILTPTRELAAQVAESIVTYSKHLPLKSTAVFGGVKIHPQMMKLRSGVDVLVATPGRLLDLYNQRAIRFSQVEVLVLDEADRMLDMGFMPDVKKIISLMPKQHQKLLFSATFSAEIRQLTARILTNPVRIEVAPENTAASTVKQSVYCVDKNRKTALLNHLIHSNGWEQALIFARTKHGANKLAEQLHRDKISAVAFHGNKTQGARTRALADFKSGKVRVLVATDIASRGIDIIDLPQVVNYELPNLPENYIHRIGRTGRAGVEGDAISLVSIDEMKFLNDIERLLQKKIERKEEVDFEPSVAFPNPELRPLKSKKPHKGKFHKKRQSSDSDKPKSFSREAIKQKKFQSKKSSKPKKPSY